MVAKTKKSWLWFALLTLVVVIGVAAVLLPWAAKNLIVREAHARGIVLDPGTIHLALGYARFQNATLSLVGVPAVTGSIDSATIALRGLSPDHVEIKGLKLSLVGFTAASSLAAWSSRYHAQLAAPSLSASDVHVGWRDEASKSERFTLLAASLETKANRTLMPDVRALVDGKQIAQTSLVWSVEPAGMTVGLGATDLAQVPLRLDLHHLPTPKLLVRLTPSPLSSIAAPLAIKLDQSAASMLLSATIELDLPENFSQPPTTPQLPSAHLQLTLTGYVPPHPKELDGLLFGNTTNVTATADLAPDFQRVTLRDVTVTAGALKLAGSGIIQPEAADVRISMDLSGSVPCSLLAQSAALAHLGDTLGLLAGRLAKRSLAGVVSVKVNVDALATRIHKANVTSTAILGCRLQG